MKLGIRDAPIAMFWPADSEVPIDSAMVNLSLHNPK